MKTTTNQERLNELLDGDPRNDTSIANALGVSKQAVCSWRKGTRSPKKSVLMKIAKEYGVSIDWLMGYDVEKTPNRSMSLVIPDSEMFAKILYYMSNDDYLTVMNIFDKTYQKMKSLGIELNVDKIEL